MRPLLHVSLRVVTPDPAVEELVSLGPKNNEDGIRLGGHLDVYCQVPVKRSCAPFDRVTVPVYVWPEIAFSMIVLVAGKMTYMVAVAEPDGPMLQLVGPVYAVLPPAQVIEIVETEALPEPVLVSVR